MSVVYWSTITSSLWSPPIILLGIIVSRMLLVLSHLKPLEFSKILELSSDFVYIFDFCHWELYRKCTVIAHYPSQRSCNNNKYLHQADRHWSSSLITIFQCVPNAVAKWVYHLVITTATTTILEWQRQCAKETPLGYQVTGWRKGWVLMRVENKYSKTKSIF